MAASSSPPLPSQQAAAADAAHDVVEITIVSAKHLKNVNWRDGPLVPYVAVYLSPNHRFSTRPDDSNSTRPVWNDRFLLPYSSFASPDSILSFDVFHSPPSDTPKPLVGSLRIPSASLLPDSPSSPSILHSLDLLRPSGRPQGKLRLKVSLRLPQFEPAPSPAPTLDYNFPREGAYHYFPASPPGYYPPSDYYPSPPPPPAAHAYVRPPSQPLPRAPPPPVDYRVAHPPPPPPTVSAYGDHHRDGNWDASSVYRPSAPVDFTYPAKELPDYRYAAVSPLPRISSGDIAYTSGGTLPHWISNRTAMWRNDQNSVSLEREQVVAPSAPAGTPVYGYRRGSEEGSVAGAFGGMRLDDGNRGHRSSNYGYSHGYGRED